MKRVVILGRGGSGKSTLAAKLGEITGLPVIELDKIFWQPGLHALPLSEWVKMQRSFVAQETWIMDGDLGPYDAVEVRLSAARYDHLARLRAGLLRMEGASPRAGAQ